MDPAAQVQKHSAQAEQLAAMPDEVREMIVLDRCVKQDQRRALEASVAFAWRRAVIEGALLFASFMALASGFGLSTTLIGAVVGAFVGVVWHLTCAGQLLAPLISMPIYMLLMLAVGDVYTIALLCAPFPFGALAGILALQRNDKTI